MRIHELPTKSFKEKFGHDIGGISDHRNKVIYIPKGLSKNKQIMVVEHEKAHLDYGKNPDAEKIGEEILQLAREAIANRTPPSQIKDVHGILPVTVKRLRLYELQDNNEASLIEEAYAQEVGYQNASRVIRSKRGAFAKQIVYHGKWTKTDTGKNFGGKHYGTKNAARDRLADILKSKSNQWGESGATTLLGIPVLEKVIISDVDILGRKEPIAEGHVTHDSKGMRREDLYAYSQLDIFKKKLIDAGYKGIAYYNAIEDPNSVSYVLFDDSPVVKRYTEKPIKVSLARHEKEMAFRPIRKLRINKVPKVGRMK
jgi:hypothetical protein